MNLLRSLIRSLILQEANVDCSPSSLTKKGRRKYCLEKEYSKGSAEREPFERFYRRTTKTSNYYYRPNSGAVKQRRKLKTLWNAFADHEWFANEVSAFHQIGYTTKDVPDLDQFLTFVKRYPSGPTNKNELSAFGYVGPNPETQLARGGWYVKLNGRVTFASSADAHTEELKYAYTDPEGERGEPTTNQPDYPDYAWVWKDTGALVGFSELEYPQEWLTTVDPNDTDFDPAMNSNTIIFWKDMQLPPKDDPDFDPVEWYQQAVKQQKFKRWSQEIKSARYKQLKELAKQGKIQGIKLADFYKNSGVPKRPSILLHPSDRDWET